MNCAAADLCHFHSHGQPRVLQRQI